MEFDYKFAALYLLYPQIYREIEKFLGRKETRILIESCDNKIYLKDKYQCTLDQIVGGGSRLCGNSQLVPSKG